MSLRKRNRRVLTIIASAGLAFAFWIGASNIEPAKASEKGAGVYLLGIRGGLAGFVPPPGTYFQNDVFYYSGKAKFNIPLPIGGVGVSGRIKAKALVEIPTLVWIAPYEIAGGHFGLSATLPVGWTKVSGSLGFLGLGASSTDSVTSLGDFFPGAIIGWHDGNLHWNLNLAVNVPIGGWKQGRLANIGFNYWAFDFGAAFTYLNPKTGIEISVAPGFTINTKNKATNYTTGEEFHVEFAAIQHLSEKFAIGVTGYHYRQIGGDSGSGAVLGAFKGRVTALGPTVSYSFKIAGALPVSTNLRWLHEFDVKRRLKGDAVFFTVAVPLGISGK